MDWADARERLRTPPFAPLGPAIDRFAADRWPTHDELTAAAAGIVTGRGKPLRFVAPPGGTERDRPGYELRAAETGEVETRPRDWHDLFNALAWLTFPNAKARINAQHAAILEERGEEESRRRGPERDALTLFDESGVVVASRSPALLRLIVEFEWKELFWRRRGELEANVRFLAFGHALHEKLVEPFIGIVAKTVFVPVDELFFMLAPQAQVERVDALLAAHFASPARFRSPRAMAPLPVLGVPGWHPGTQSEAFYDDASYFRRRRERPGPSRAA